MKKTFSGKYWLVAREKFRGFDIFDLGNSVLLYLFFGLIFLPIIGTVGEITHNDFLRRVKSIDALTAFYATIGAVFFFWGYKFFKKILSLRKSRPFLDAPWRDSRTPYVLAAVFIANLVLKIFIIAGGGYFHSVKSLSFASSPIYSLIGTINWLGAVSLGMAFIYYFRLLKENNPRARDWRLIAWGIFLAEFVYGFMSGSKLAAVIPILVCLLVSHYLYKKSYPRIILGLVLIVAVILPLQSFYNRLPVFLYSYMGMGGGGQSEAEAVSGFIFDNSVKRLNQSEILAGLFRNTDEFLYGKSLLNFFVSFGPPRFIWKDKPVINAGGNELGRKYGVLDPQDFQTSVGPTILGDWYLNFGILGITIGMFLTGALYGLVYHYLIEKTHASDSGVLIYSVFWIQLIKGTEDWLAPVWAGLVKFLVVLLVLHCLLTCRGEEKRLSPYSNKYH